MKKEDLVEDAPSRDIDSHENTNNDDHNPIYNAVNDNNTNSPHVVNADQGTHEMMLSEAITPALKLSIHSATPPSSFSSSSRPRLG